MAISETTRRERIAKRLGATDGGNNRKPTKTEIIGDLLIPSEAATQASIDALKDVKFEPVPPFANQPILQDGPGEANPNLVHGNVTTRQAKPKRARLEDRDFNTRLSYLRSEMPQFLAKFHAEFGFSFSDKLGEDFDPVAALDQIFAIEATHNRSSSWRVLARMLDMHHKNAVNALDLFKTYTGEADTSAEDTIAAAQLVVDGALAKTLTPTGCEIVLRALKRVLGA